MLQDEQSPQESAAPAIEALLSARGDFDIAAAQAAGGDKARFIQMLIGEPLPSLKEQAQKILLIHYLSVLEALAFHTTAKMDDMTGHELAREIRLYFDKGFMLTLPSEGMSAHDNAPSQLDVLSKVFANRYPVSNGTHN